MSWGLLGFFPEEWVKVPLTRYADGAINARGKWEKGASTAYPEFEIIAPQPLSSNELKMLPQGEEASDYLVSFSRELVQTRVKKEDSDEIEWDGNLYKVTQVNNRAQLGGFYRFRMVRIRGQV